MRHKRIQTSKRHKKLKAVNSVDDVVNGVVGVCNVNETNAEQKMPRKQRDLMLFADNYERKNRHKKKRRKNNELICVKTSVEKVEKGMTRLEKQMPEKVEQGPYESQFHFLLRLSKLSAKARAEATIEQRFDVDFCPKSQSDSHIKTPIDTQSDDIETTNRDVKVKNRNRINRNKRKMMKNRKHDNSFEHLTDVIQFGETVKEPPSFTNLKHRKTSKF